MNHEEQVLIFGKVEQEGQRGENQSYEDSVRENHPESDFTYRIFKTSGISFKFNSRKIEKEVKIECYLHKDDD